MSLFLYKNTNKSTFSGNKFVCFGLTIFPAVENTLLKLADVAGIHKYFLAISVNLEYFVLVFSTILTDISYDLFQYLVNIFNSELPSLGTCKLWNIKSKALLLQN